MNTTTCAQPSTEATHRSLGAWEREAWALIAEAEQQGVLIAEHQLAWFDVRDLQSLRLRLASDHTALLRDGVISLS
ncbi:MAG TPA: hypothetical protein VJN88_03085 [Ktedonobacterales bacterium]|nr:hypothetical protein [Ktedonobacterales bacterium]